MAVSWSIYLGEGVTVQASAASAEDPLVRYRWICRSCEEDVAILAPKMSVALEAHAEDCQPVKVLTLVDVAPRHSADCECMRCLAEQDLPEEVRNAVEAKRSHGELRSCRVCGCTDDDCMGCVERTGEPCTWVDEDLCSACVGDAIATYATPELEATLRKWEADQAGDDVEVTS